MIDTKFSLPNSIFPHWQGNLSTSLHPKKEYRDQRHAWGISTGLTWLSAEWFGHRLSLSSGGSRVTSFSGPQSLLSVSSMSKHSEFSKSSLKNSRVSIKMPCGQEQEQTITWAGRPSFYWRNHSCLGFIYWASIKNFIWRQASVALTCEYHCTGDFWGPLGT